MHAFPRVNNTASSRDNSTTMGSIEDAIAFLRSSDDPNIVAVAERFSFNRSTLSKRFRGKTGSVARRIEGRRLLTNKQEQELVKQIRRLCEWRFTMKGIRQPAKSSLKRPTELKFRRGWSLHDGPLT